MARRIIELITSDLTGEEVDESKVKVVKFAWEGALYEFDSGPSDGDIAGAYTIQQLLDVSRPGKRGAGRPATTVTRTPAGGTRGPVAGAPKYSPDEYFELYGAMVNGK